MRYKYYIGRSFDPYRNLAVEQALLSYVQGDIAILYLWQNDRTVVVGRNQDINAECRLSELLKYGGKPARRRSGGGAVYHDLGNLNYSILCRESAQDDREYYERLCAVIGRYGLTARYNGRNDITVDGKKISGNAQYISGGNSCRHGTFLVNTDFSAMERFLTPPPEKLDRNHIQSVRSRVANLTEYIPSLTVERFAKDMLACYDAGPLEESLVPGTIRRLTQFYQSSAWLYGGLE